MTKEERKKLKESAKQISQKAKEEKNALKTEIAEKKKSEAEAAKKSKMRKKQKPPKIVKTTLDILPIRNIGPTGFLLEDKSILDIYQVVGKSYYNATDEDIASQVERLAYFFRVYKADLKLVAINYPTNTRAQQQYLDDRLSNPELERFYPLLMEKKNTLEYLEKHTTARELFLFIYAEENQYDAFKNLLLSKAALNIAEIDQQKKENIIFLLNNMCKDVRK